MNRHFQYDILEHDVHEGQPRLWRAFIRWFDGVEIIQRENFFSDRQEAGEWVRVQLRELERY